MHKQIVLFQRSVMYAFNNFCVFASGGCRVGSRAEQIPGQHQLLGNGRTFNERTGLPDMAKKAGVKKGNGSSEPIFASYKPLASTYDEYFAEAGKVRPHTSTVVQQLESLGRDEIRERMRLAHASFLEGGITFSVYSDARGGERVFPFDALPRVIDPVEWKLVDQGLKQRVEALNSFLGDIYGRQRILKDKLGGGAIAAEPRRAPAGVS